MMRVPFLAFTVLAASVVLAGAAPVEKRVYRIDSVVATLRGGRIAVEVKGAVQSGGWTRPRLHALRGDVHTIALELLARPPEPDAPVIQGLLPIAARTTVRARRGVVAVKVMADANEVTAQILPPGK